MRILYIAYAFPPVNIVSAQRAMFQARYMAEAGAQVELVCAEQSRRRKDPTMLRHLGANPNLRIHRLGAWHPSYSVTFTASGKGPLWTVRAVARGTRLHTDQPFDVIYSTFGPLHPHVVAHLLHRRLGIRWVAEYRDPWNGRGDVPRDRLSSLRLRAERWLLAPAHSLVTVSEGFRQTLQSVHGHARHVEVIYNGYEPGLYRGVQPDPTPGPGTGTTFVLAGTVYPAQLPHLRTLLRCLPAMEEARFVYHGACYRQVEALIAELGVAPWATAGPQIPLAEVTGHVLAADIAVLPVAEALQGHIPVKLFDYLAASKPVMLLGDPGTEAEAVLCRSRLGRRVDSFPEVLRFVADQQAGRFRPQSTEDMTRRHQALRLLEYLERVRSGR